MKPALSDHELIELIDEVGFPCLDPKGLNLALDIIFFDPNYWHSSSPTKASKLKKNEELHEELMQHQDEMYRSALWASALLKKREARILKQYDCFSSEDIKKAGTILLILLEMQSEEKKEWEKTIVDNNQFIDREAAKKVHPSSVLIGHLIPSLYKEYFGREWGVSRPPEGGEAYGPAIRFSQAILKKLGLDKNAEAICMTVRRTRERQCDT